MSVLVNTFLGWLRRNLAWSNSRQSWQERIALALLLAGAGVLVWAQRGLSPAQVVVLAGVLLLGLAILLRRGWLKLFGPVLFYDLICIGRRRRFFVFRTAYAVLLLFLLAWVYAMWLVDTRSGYLPARKMADFAASFFYMFLGVQFVIVAVLTPAYTAGAVAEEKERKTLEFLLATDLRNREIVLSKLAARLASLALLVLTGLPVLSILQFVGGVDPDLLLAGFAVTGLTLASLAGLSILNSVLIRKPRDAIALTYLGAGAYLLLSWLSQGILSLSPAVASFPSTGSWTSPVTVADVVAWFSAGDPVLGLFKLTASMGSGAQRDETLTTLLRNYAVFHGLIAVGCPVWAVLRLRAVALKETYGRAQRLPLLTRLLGRSRVGNSPMLWKELQAESRLRFNWVGRIVVGVLLLGSFVPALFIIGHYLEALGSGAPGYRTPAYWLAWQMNGWVRSVGTIVACLMLLAVAVRAASSITGERDKQTFDGLLTTPLSAEAILFAKWLGSILSVRWAWAWLGLIWLLGVITGGLHVLALPLLLIAWAVYAAVLAGVGLWFSTVCRTSLRATLWTLLTTVGITVGHWLLLGLGCYLPISFSGINSRDMRYVLQFQAGQTPPFVLGWLAMQGDEFDRMDQSVLEMTGFALIGIFCWAGLAAFVWTATLLRFRKVTNRMPTLPPDRPFVRRALAAKVSREEAHRSHVQPRGAVLITEVWSEEVPDGARLDPRDDEPSRPASPIQKPPRE
jgi:ABC-type transport system involved in multi-copper enzyme maturation permease subunit